LGDGLAEAPHGFELVGILKLDLLCILDLERVVSGAVRMSLHLLSLAQMDGPASISDEQQQNN